MKENNKFLFQIKFYFNTQNNMSKYTKNFDKIKISNIVIEKKFNEIYKIIYNFKFFKN